MFTSAVVYILCFTRVAVSENDIPAKFDEGLIHSNNSTIPMFFTSYSTDHGPKFMNFTSVSLHGYLAEKQNFKNNSRENVNNTVNWHTKSITQSTETDAVINIAENKRLTHDDIAKCVLRNTTLELRVENETSISYFQHKHQLNANERESTLPGSLHSQHKEAANLLTQLCSLSFTAPPDKVFSILILNQTCSHQNHVLIRDLSDGSISIWNGCRPWISPGYDVTTSNKSALVVIHLHDLSDSYRLEIHIRVVTAPKKWALFTRYISSVFGYIQTPSWHPYAKGTFSGHTSTSVVIKVPSHHRAMISVAYINIHSKSSGFCPGDYLQLLQRPKQKRLFSIVWTKCQVDRRGVNLFPGIVKDIGVLVSGLVGKFFSGIRILFSFHQGSLVPRRVRKDVWNCSSPSWPDFLLHLWCNSRAECAGREDEMWCQDTSCQHGGMKIEDTCYFFHRHLEHNEWGKAQAACVQRGAALASFPTRTSWYHLALVLQFRRPAGFKLKINIGLQSAEPHFPNMYRYALQWNAGPIAHYVPYTFYILPPNCGQLDYPIMIIMNHCGSTFTEAETLCKVSAALSGKETSREIGETRNATGGPMLIASILCPLEHRTHDFLACDARSACWFDYDTASGGSNANMVCTVSRANNFTALFACRAGAKLIPYSLVCDHTVDCLDSSDEDFCVFPLCSSVSVFQCLNGQCVPLHHRCDAIVQCLDMSDEDTCETWTFNKFKGTMPPEPPLLVDFDGIGHISYTCLNKESDDCEAACPDTHVMCPDHDYCVPVYVRCNDVPDCPGQEDEVGCGSYVCPGFYRCRGFMTCVHPDHVCDGLPQCPEHDDERFCNLTCPSNCTCLGHAFTCFSHFQVELFSRLRYLDASGSGLQAERLGTNGMLIYLSLAMCNLTHLGNLSLRNLVVLDLSNNRFTAISAADLNRLKNLRNLAVARNPLTGLFVGNFTSGFQLSDVLLHLDLTGVSLEELNVQRSLPFPGLMSLNLSETGVIRLIGDGFQSLTSLTTLDVRGCPMTVLSWKAFQGLRNLHHVFADNFKLCCSATLPEGFTTENCQAPFSEVSSCDSLLRSDAYRVGLSLLAALSLIGNGCCFCLRLFALKGRGKSGFTVFVTHLCMSDFLMGVYLATIGVADRMYRGRYLWEDSRWRRSVACQVVGFLAMLSSEASALIICLITLDRFLVIRFPFSNLRFAPLSAQVASVMTWTGCFMLAIVPFLPLTHFTQFYGHTGICIPLPITRNDFAGHHYAFGVMILLNLVIFVLIAIGQISIYQSMVKNAMSTSDSSVKSRDLIVARRLIAVVMSDFLCWFPIGLLGVLAIQRVSIPGEVNVGMAIFVLPLNSALNPFLYTLNVIQEKRQKATEEKLLKIIIDLRLKDDEETTTH